MDERRALAEPLGQLQTFKIILDETTNKITSTIVVVGGGGSAATRGIERQDGLAAAQASCDQVGLGGRRDVADLDAVPR